MSGFNLWTSLIASTINCLKYYYLHGEEPSQFHVIKVFCYIWGIILICKLLYFDRNKAFSDENILLWNVNKKQFVFFVILINKSLKKQNLENDTSMITNYNIKLRFHDKYFRFPWTLLHQSNDLYVSQIKFADWPLTSKNP